MYHQNTVSDVRHEFAEMLLAGEFGQDKSGGLTLEMVGATFVADDETLFGKVNHDYVAREIAWYESTSRNVNDIPGETPIIWQQVADDSGVINSNYGWCIFTKENGEQYANVLAELTNNGESTRRGQMIYTRPSMWKDYNENGRSDFICTDSVQYFIRRGELIAHVRMRSNDAWAGYRNDFAWQKHVRDRLLLDLNRAGKKVEVGRIIWTAGSLHIYDRQFYLVYHYIATGETHISKKEYAERYASDVEGRRYI